MGLKMHVYTKASIFRISDRYDKLILTFGMWPLWRFAHVRLWFESVTFRTLDLFLSLVSLSYSDSPVMCSFYEYWMLLLDTFVLDIKWVVSLINVLKSSLYMTLVVRFLNWTPPALEE